LNRPIDELAEVIDTSDVTRSVGVEGGAADFGAGRESRAGERR
jgi:hypothetical protein